MYVVGVDPGLSGALALRISPSAKIEVYKMPSVQSGKGKIMDMQALTALLKSFKERAENDGDTIEVIIEDIHAIVVAGKSSNFRMGLGVGIIHGIIAALGIPMRRVTAVKWKAQFELLKKSKDASRMKAMEIAPYLSLQLSKKCNDGLAEALLIALYNPSMATSR